MEPRASFTLSFTPFTLARSASSEQTLSIRDLLGDQGFFLIDGAVAR